MKVHVPHREYFTGGEPCWLPYESPQPSWYSQVDIGTHAIGGLSLGDFVPLGC